MEGKEKLLTIGQFAAIHGINKKTLMWYDEIGLFSPIYINPENGYRYYNYHQSSLLETILLLRELDVSIEEIQAFLAQRSAASLNTLLEKNITALDQRLIHLKAARKTLDSYRQNMVTLLTMDLSEICLIEQVERRLVTVDISPDISFDKEVELILSAAKDYQLRRLHDASYGTMLPVEAIYQGNYSHYSKLFLEIPFPIKKTGLHLQPGGTYVRAFHKGDWNNISNAYQKILSYAKEQGLTLSGYSYEIGINEAVIERIEDYITQIEIPVL